MKIKIFLVLMLLLISSCEYKPIFNEAESKFSITKIDSLTKDQIFFRIKNSLKSNLNNDNFNKFELFLTSDRIKTVTSKDKKGNEKTFNLKIFVKVNIKSRNESFEKFFEENFSYQNNSNKFDLKQYENNITNDLIDKIVKDLNLYLVEITK